MTISAVIGQELCIISKLLSSIKPLWEFCALDDGDNFQCPQGVSQNRNIHNIAMEFFMKATEKSRAKAKACQRTMEILQECRCVFFKKWGVISKNTKKKNSGSLGEDSDDDEVFNFDDMEVF